MARVERREADRCRERQVRQALDADREGPTALGRVIARGGVAERVAVHCAEIDERCTQFALRRTHVQWRRPWGSADAKEAPGGLERYAQ
jgi:hypothetical protein